MLCADHYDAEECVVWKDLKIYADKGDVWLRITFRFFKGEK